MTIKEFIERAIDGGWKYNKHRFRKLEVGALYGYTKVWISDDKKCDSEVITISVFLDPAAWQAVGKVEGWHSSVCVHEGNWTVKHPRCDTPNDLAWKDRMHSMIDALVEGKNIEEYLETL